MNICILQDKSDLHQVRGIGTYTSHLIDGLSKYGDIELSVYKTDVNSEEIKTNDIVHYPNFDFFIRSLLLYPKTKTVVTIHDVIPLRFPEKFPRGLKGTVNLYFQKKALQKVDAIITDSQSSKSDIHKFLAIPTEKIHVVYLAADSLYKPLNINQSKKYFLYVGDVNWNKNISTLLKVFGNIIKKYEDYHLLLVGKSLIDNTLPETRDIASLINVTNSSLHIHRLGYVSDDDLVNLYNNAIAYIQPSYYEGFGLPVLEAMQCGTPVIVSNSSSLTEIVQDAGIYIDPYKNNSLSDSIIKVISMNKTDRESLIKKSILQAKKFSWEKTIYETVAVYKKLL